MDESTRSIGRSPSEDYRRWAALCARVKGVYLQKAQALAMPDPGLASWFHLGACVWENLEHNMGIGALYYQRLVLDGEWVLQDLLLSVSMSNQVARLIPVQTHWYVEVMDKLSAMLWRDVDPVWDFSHLVLQPELSHDGDVLLSVDSAPADWITAALREAFRLPPP